ncbi:SDR family oxidoreductase [Galbibacter mesophilus]|uniref:SDR family oxidoreductase n=1 Tax=Galbibacter mesophilus TaxID=379069 RepID=UPI00191F09A7|nr:SDR family oxidoreductase [Galbibacter mesophilus]MCM5664029.1 SDR family oxidoreductase [Galbibacter mesophilus]
MEISCIKNKKILVTGATSGIGRILTLKLLKIGASVAFCGRKETKMKKLIDEISVSEQNYFFECFDVTDENKIIHFVNNATEKIGEIDVLVNCAGANTAKDSVKDIQLNDLEYMLKLNTIAPFIFIRELYGAMSNKKSGQIINVLSTVCNFSNEGTGAYTASKASLDALMKVFRKESRADNIKVSSIYPGGVDSDFRETLRPEYLKPEQVADSIISMMNFNDVTSIDELVIRPLIEKNYA